MCARLGSGSEAVAASGGVTRVALVGGVLRWTRIKNSQAVLIIEMLH